MFCSLVIVLVGAVTQTYTTAKRGNEHALEGASWSDL